MTFQDFLDNPNITAIDFNDGSFVHDTCDYSDEYREQVIRHLSESFQCHQFDVNYSGIDGISFLVDGQQFFISPFEYPTFAPHCLEQSGGNLC